MSCGGPSGCPPVPVDFREPPPLVRRVPSQEEAWLEREADEIRTRPVTGAELNLSPTQRRWLAALAEAAARGDFFTATAEPNLAAASRLLGRNRSSAQRAYREIQRRFEAEKRRAGS